VGRQARVQALGAFVETGTTTEWDALDRRDDWKAKHR
jgi:hypothetical protein